MEDKGNDSIQTLVAKHKAKAEEKQKKLDEKHDKIDELKQDGVEVDDEESNIMSNTTFEELGICSEICEAIRGMGYKVPTKI